MVDIKLVDVHRVSHYLSKYLTKDLLLSAPSRCRRVTTLARNKAAGEDPHRNKVDSLEGTDLDIA
jgi:hypothetical protein